MDNYSQTKLFEIISSIFKADMNEINIESNIETIDRWDSLGHLELIIEIEQAFNIKFDTKKIPTLNSVRILLEEIDNLKI